MELTEQQEIIKQRLAEIEQKNGGVLRPEDVVADARNKASPLHALPIWNGWDAKKSAMAFWIDQARVLIRTVQMIVTTETTVVRAPYYVRDPSSDPSKQGYVSVATLKSDEDRAREALVYEFQRVAALLRRARDLAIVLGIGDEVDRLVENIAGIRAAISAEHRVQQ